MSDAVWPFPNLFEQPDLSRASTPITLRYEDLTQAGQVKLTALPHAIGRACFEEIWVKSPMLATMHDGTLPILTRMLIETDDATTLLGVKLEAHGVMQVAHEPDDAGGVRALVLNMQVELFGPLGRSVGPQPTAAGSRVRLGRVFAEHVFTRPFAPAAERKVLRFAVPDMPAVPEAVHHRTQPASLLVLPEHAQPLDAELLPDRAPWVFGLMHTDHNQHVNSLVYARMFEEAALRRLDEHGQSANRLARSVELVYRKPCFAGDRLVCRLRAFQSGQSTGVVGFLGAPEAAPERAHCTLRMLF